MSSVTWRRVVWLWSTDVAEEPAAFIVRVVEAAGVVCPDDLVSVPSDTSGRSFWCEDSPRGHRSQTLRPHLVLVSYWARAQNCEKRLLASSCLSVRPHGKTPLPLDGFSWNLIFEDFSKACRENSSFFKNLTIITGTLHEDRCIFVIISRWIILRMRCRRQKL